MSINDAQKFRGVEHWSDTDYITELENNLYFFLNQAFLKIGAFQNISSGYSTAYGRLDELRLLPDNNFTSGQIWQGIRKDWAWETGVMYTGTDDSEVSPTGTAIYVNGVAPTGNYAVNYREGLVFFEQAVSATNSVTATHSIRYVQIYLSQDAKWWKQIQLNSLRADEESWDNDQFNSGIRSILTQNRVQLPAILIESTTKSRSTPYQLGSTASWVEHTVLFNVIAEDPQTRNKVMNALSRQEGRSFYLYDSDLVAAAGDFPFNSSGDIADATKDYNYFITNHKDQVVRWKSSQVTNIDAPNSDLFFGVVSATFELIA
jgi:hypothetical protein